MGAWPWSAGRARRWCLKAASLLHDPTVWAHTAMMMRTMRGGRTLLWDTGVGPVGHGSVRPTWIAVEGLCLCVRGGHMCGRQTIQCSCATQHKACLCLPRGLHVYEPALATHKTPSCAPRSAAGDGTPQRLCQLRWREGIYHHPLCQLHNTAAHGL